MTRETLARRRALIVLGVHRSGTSAMARSLSLAGGALPTNVMPAARGNPTGHWEPQRVADFNDEVLASLDSRWDDPFGPRRRKNKRLPLGPFVSRARDLIRSEYGDSDPIVVKEPRLGLLLDLWRQVFEAEEIGDYYVIMVRRPDEVAGSLADRDGMEPNKALLLWSTYMIAAEAMTRDKPRVFIKYNDLLLNIESVLDRIEDAFSIDLPRRTWISASETRQFLRSDLRHHSASGAMKLPRELNPITDLFGYFDAAADGKPKNDDVPATVADWLSALEGAVGPLVAIAERNAVIARDQTDRLRSELDSAIGQLAESRRASEAERAQAEASLDELVSQARREAQTAHEQAETLHGALKVANARIAQLEQAYSDRSVEAHNEIAERQAEAARLDAEAEAARTQAAQLALQVEEARRAAQAAQAQAEVARTALAAANLRVGELVTLEAEAARAGRLAQELEQAQGDAQAMRAEASALQAGLDELRAQTESLAAEARRGAQTAATLQEALAKAEIAAADAATQRDSLTGQIADVGRELNLLRDRGLETERTLRGEMARTEAAAAAAAQVAADRQTAYEAAKNQVERLEETIRSMESDRAWRFSRSLLGPMRMLRRRR